MKRHLPFDQAIATRWLLPGAPERVERIAKRLDYVKDLGSSREFTACEGIYEGTHVGVCSTGIGPASTAICVEDLVASGAKVLVRVGTCGSLVDDVKAGDVCVATGAVRADGTGEAYAPLGFPAVPDLVATTLLARNTKVAHRGVTFSSSAFHREPSSYVGAKFVEMEAATLFVVALLKGVAAGCVLACVDDKDGWVDDEPGIDDAIEVALEAIR